MARCFASTTRRCDIGERRRYEPGTFCWVGLATSDPTSAKAFYTSLFGWHAEDLEAGAVGGYTTLRHRGKEVAILYMQQPEARAAGAPPHWTSYISVEDADGVAARAGELGGAAVFREPFDVLDAGRVAAIRDPTKDTVPPLVALIAKHAPDDPDGAWDAILAAVKERASGDGTVTFSNLVLLAVGRA